MIKVKASLKLKEKAKLPTDVCIDIPQEYCNRTGWNDYIKKYLWALLEDNLVMDFELIE